MPKLKSESLFPISILPSEFQKTLAVEIKEKLALAKDQLPVKPVYHESADFAERIMLKMLKGNKPSASSTAPLLFLQRGRENYQDAVNHPFNFSITGDEDSTEAFTEGPFPPLFAAAIAYLHQECDGINAMRFDTQAANDLGVNTTASFGDGLRGFANQISLFAKTSPLGITPQKIIATVAERQTEMYQINLKSCQSEADVNCQTLALQESSELNSTDRLRRVHEQEDGLHAVLHGQHLLFSLLLFPWEEPDSGRLLISPE